MTARTESRMILGKKYSLQCLFRLHLLETNGLEVFVKHLIYTYRNNKDKSKYSPVELSLMNIHYNEWDDIQKHTYEEDVKLYKNSFYKYYSDVPLTFTKLFDVILEPFCLMWIDMRDFIKTVIRDQQLIITECGKTFMFTSESPGLNTKLYDIISDKDITNISTMNAMEFGNKMISLADTEVIKRNSRLIDKTIQPSYVNRCIYNIFTMTGQQVWEDIIVDSSTRWTDIQKEMEGRRILLSEIKSDLDNDTSNVSLPSNDSIFCDLFKNSYIKPNEKIIYKIVSEFNN